MFKIRCFVQEKLDYNYYIVCFKNYPERASKEEWMLYNIYYTSCLSRGARRKREVYYHHHI